MSKTTSLSHLLNLLAIDSLKFLITTLTIQVIMLGIFSKIFTGFTGRNQIKKMSFASFGRHPLEVSFFISKFNPFKFLFLTQKQV